MSHGFTMLEILVVVCILLAMVAAFTTVFAPRTSSPRENPTRLLIDGILCSMASYRLNCDSCPPSTGTIELATGTTKPFAEGEPAEADAIRRYLGRQVAQPESIKIVNGLSIVVDQWGNPFRLDFVRDPSDPQKTKVRVWSLGPDGQEGPVPFSRAKDRSDPRDQDNLANW
jgi:type II secretory pathway pseudopilin PulG